MKKIEQAILTFENKKNVFLDMKMQLELAKGNSMSLIVVESIIFVYLQMSINYSVKIKQFRMILQMHLMILKNINKIKKKLIIYGQQPKETKK